MKKILVIVLLTLFITTGCSSCINVKKSTIDQVIDSSLNSKFNLTNHINKGFKYYLPKKLSITKLDETNEIIKYKNYEYYLYVDLVSYYNKKDLSYNVDESAKYSRLLLNGENKGIVSIYDNGDECFISVDYKYARIETKVNSLDINENMANIMVILSSLKYNDDVIKNILTNDKKVEDDEVVEVFDNKKNESTSLDVEEPEYTGNEEEDYDPDVIN